MGTYAELVDYPLDGHSCGALDMKAVGGQSTWWSLRYGQGWPIEIDRLIESGRTEAWAGYSYMVSGRLSSRFGVVLGHRQARPPPVSPRPKLDTRCIQERVEDSSRRRRKREMWPDVPAGRRNIMRAIRSRDTGPELQVRSLLHAMGYRFLVDVRRLSGRPDIVFTRREKAVFVHGCFWHSHPGCNRAAVPVTRTDYWHPKLKATTERDTRAQRDLANLGWKTLVVWECELRDRDTLRNALQAFLGEPRWRP